MSECNEVTNLSRVETACRMKRSRNSRSWRGGVGQPRLEVRPRPRDRARAGRDRTRAVRGRVQPVRPRGLRLERVSERPRAPGLLARGTAGRQGGDGRPEARPVARPAARRRERPLRRRLRARLAQCRAHGPLEDVSRVEATIANLKAALEPHVITTGRNLWVHWWCAVPVPLSRRVVDVIRAQAAHRQGRARRGGGRQTAVPGRLDGVLRRCAFPGGDSARLDAIDDGSHRSAGATSSSPRPSRTPARSCACRRRAGSISKRTHKRRRDPRAPNNFNYCYNTKDPPSNHPSSFSSSSASRRALPFFWRAASTTIPPRARRASQEARRHPRRPRQSPRSLF